jgi:uncharacterized repeat protein (TIGR01451 family)
MPRRQVDGRRADAATRMMSSRLTLAIAFALTTAPIGSAVAQVAATPTAAGTVVSNVASVTVGTGPNQLKVDSNTARTTVAERLDIALQTANTALSVPRGVSTIRFTLTNTGNGTEAFVLSGQLDGVDATILGFAVDRNGDGLFDPAVDLAIAANGATPSLAPGQSVQLLVRLQSNTAGSTGTLKVHAAAATGSGAQGTAFPGQGDGGSDAVVGPTTAAASLAFTLAVTAPLSTEGITVVKSQQVSGSNASTIPAPGATVTYTIVATFAATGVSPAARLLDPIPANTKYVAGSLTLDGAALSDVADTDAGVFDGSGIAVALGDVAGPTAHTVQFKVTIQ